MSLPCLGLSCGFVCARPRIDRQMHTYSSKKQEVENRAIVTAVGTWNDCMRVPCLRVKPTTCNIRRCTNYIVCSKTTRCSCGEQNSNISSTKPPCSHIRVPIPIQSLIDNMSVICSNMVQKYGCMDVKRECSGRVMWVHICARNQSAGNHQMRPPRPITKQQFLVQ